MSPWSSLEPLAALLGGVLLVLASGIDLVLSRIGNEIVQLSVADVPTPSMHQVQSLVDREGTKIDEIESRPARAR